MTFRQNEFFLKECAGLAVLFLLIAVVLSIGAGEILWPAAACAALSLVLFLHVRRTEPMVRLDEQGIRCFTVRETLWEFRWEEIAEVRKATRYRNPAAVLIPVREQKQDLHTPQGHPFLGFQLSRTARAALKAYCPGLREEM